MFEYMQMKIPMLGFIEQCNQLGRDGWEMIQIDHQQEIVYFKRRIG